MNRQLLSDVFGTILFQKGMPANCSDYLLPQAEMYYANGVYGTICLQEVHTEKQLFIHVLFALQTSLRFSFIHPREGLHSSLSLKGEFLHRVKGSKEVILHEKEYILLHAGKEAVHMTVGAGSLHSLVTTYYSEKSYAGLLPLFPAFSKAIKKAFQKSFYLFRGPRVARYTVHDAIYSIWQEHYLEHLQQKHIEIRLESCLFTLLAQSYTPRLFEDASAAEKEKAFAAQAIMTGNIKKRWTIEDIAKELNCSPSWLKRTFRKVYGTGLYHYLRRMRMERAKELFLKGESLKAVAIEVGMKPHNFPKEFKTFFGYTVTHFKKSIQ